MLLGLHTDFSGGRWGGLVFSSFKSFPQFVVIHTVKCFGIVNEAEVDVFLEFSCFFYDPVNIGNLISGSSAFSKSSLNIWKFLVHILLKPSLDNFEHCFASMWDDCNCEVVCPFFGIAFLWDCNENWPFPVLWPLQSFLNLLTYWQQHFYSLIFRIHAHPTINFQKYCNQRKVAWNCGVWKRTCFKIIAWHLLFRSLNCSVTQYLYHEEIKIIHMNKFLWTVNAFLDFYGHKMLIISKLQLCSLIKTDIFTNHLFTYLKLKCTVY